MISVLQFLGFGGASIGRDGPKTPLWLVTFTDLVGILVAFFVLLFSFSAIKADSWNAMTGRLASAPEDHSAPGNTGTRLVESRDRGLSSDPLPAVAFDLTYVKALIERRTAILDDQGEIAGAGLRVDVADNRLRAFISADDLLNPDGRALSAEGRRLMAALAPVFSYSRNKVAFLVLSETADGSDWNAALRSGRLVRKGLEEAGYGGLVGVYARTGQSRSGVELIVHPGEREARDG